MQVGLRNEPEDDNGLPWPSEYLHLDSLHDATVLEAAASNNNENTSNKVARQCGCLRRSISPARQPLHLSLNIAAQYGRRGSVQGSSDALEAEHGRRRSLEILASLVRGR
jgi:hypothetical protein